MLNQYPNTFTFNGHSSDEFGIRIEKKPDLNRSARKFNSASVAGRNGNIYQLQDAWEEVIVSYDIYAGGRQKGDAIPAFTAIVEWLNSADDYAELTDSYDPEHYRLAVFVDDIDIESQWHTIGKATIKFRCKPQRYINTNNVLPKLTSGSYGSTPITASVDANGVVSVSRISASGAGTAVIPFSTAFTFDDSTKDAKICMNNSVASNTEVTFCYRQSGLYVVFTTILDVINKTFTVPQRALGNNVTDMTIIVPKGTTEVGTFKPEVQVVGSNTISVASGGSINNLTKHTAYPIITMTGSEIVTSMLNLETPYNISLDSNSVNWYSEWLNNIAFMYNKITTASYGTYMTITTYRQAGTPVSEGGSLISHVNSTGTLRFKPFRWVNSDVGIGRGMTLTPDTDYTISCTTTAGNSKIWVGFFESDGNKKYNSSAEASRSGAGQLSLTFRVPATCSNTLFIFYRTDNTEGTFSNIMLASGTEVLPFQPYQSLATETLTINGTTLSFQTSGFNTAVIDCEKENFTIDGVNANASSIIYDQYGNLATNYLCLAEGNNTVTYSHDITAVSIVPNFWEI